MVLKYKSIALFAAAMLPVMAQAQKADTADSEITEVKAETRAARGQVVAAAASDILPGADVMDTSGDLVGRVETVDEKGAVVTTGPVRAKLPFRSFGKSDRGLIISLSREQFEAAARLHGES